ncbi:MAG TPA: citrate/2-methylcitrate synthase [Dehalococcoidia bacterium]|nr:citrate/2-methylcitrate synthase [Dehalococcoidia bacterium]
MTNSIERRPGLRDVIAGDTQLCELDEKASRVYLYGHSLEELAETQSFEGVAYLTLFGEQPAPNFRFGAPDVETLRKVWLTLESEPAQAHPMGLLRTAMSSYGNHVEASEPQSEQTQTLEAERERSLRLVPHTGYLVGQVGRHREGRAWLAPRPDRGYAAEILRLLRDEAPDDLSAKALDITLILYAEHEFNAGSFGVRIAASAHSDLYSSVVAGECVLRGPRHGCANEEVMKLLIDQGGNPEKIREYCDRFFEQPGARIPGFGHAVYNLPHSQDPRVAILKPWAKELSRAKGDMRWYETILALEEYMAERMKPRVARGNPNAPANMDLWTAPIYYLLGIPIPMYTPLFAASRIAGWAAHYLECRYVNSEPLIRPRARYVGPEARPFTASELHGTPAH